MFDQIKEISNTVSKRTTKSYAKQVNEDFKSDPLPSQGYTMKGGYYRPKGRRTWRVWYPWKGKLVFKNKYLDGTPLYHEEQAKRVLEKIRAEVDQGIFDPAIWGRERTLIFQNAWKIYMEQCPAGKDRMQARERIYTDLILPYFKDKSLKEIEEHHIKEWWSGVVGCSSVRRCLGLSSVDRAGSSKGFVTRTEQGKPKDCTMGGHSEGPDSDKVETEITDRPLHYAPSTLRVIRATLRAFLNFHRVTRVKMLDFPKVEVPKKAIEWLRAEDQDKVIEFIPVQHRPVIAFIRAYGCRVSEACNLKKTDIDFQKREIVFRERKNAKDNAVAMMPRVEPLLRSGKVTHLEYIFCTLNGLKYTRQALYNVWEAANKKAHEKYGVLIVSLKNATRHSLACRLLEEGKSTAEVARILGNTPTVVGRYYGTISVKRTGEILKVREG